MRHRLHFAALIAISLVGAAGQALAQGAEAAPGTGTTPPVGAQNPESAGISSAPGGPSTTTTGMGTDAGPRTDLNTGGFNQPGAPDRSTTGTGGAPPNGLSVDDPYIREGWVSRRECGSGRRSKAPSPSRMFCGNQFHGSRLDQRFERTARRRSLG
ncbi:MAG: hypothetical protein JWL86_4186 [Rhizobium sp.]|nr:hypothetical protein [Rhizobium sp.]